MINKDSENRDNLVLLLKEELGKELDKSLKGRLATSSLQIINLISSTINNLGKVEFVSVAVDDMGDQRIHKDDEAATEERHVSYMDTPISKENTLDRYVEAYGYHFNDKLAEFACGKMRNRNGMAHYWSASQVRDEMASINMVLPKNATLSDFQYVANMAYADFFPTTLDSERRCVRYAFDYINDPDGYEGIAFVRWLADIHHQGNIIDWSTFM